MEELISKKDLHDEIVKLEVSALEQMKILAKLGNTEEYNKMNAVLMERTAFKYDVVDAPVILEIPDGGIGDLSDGYHTFNQLYYQRMILFAALVKVYKTFSWKSFCHDDLCGIITGIDSDKVKRLTKIVEITGAEIVLSSDWKDGWEKFYTIPKPSHAKYLDNHLYKKGKLTIKDKTPNTSKGSWFRGNEILAYLRSHQDVEKYVILDDTFFEDFSIKEISEHLVLTDHKVGLTDFDVEKAIKILGE